MCRDALFTFTNHIKTQFFPKKRKKKEKKLEMSHEFFIFGSTLGIFFPLILRYVFQKFYVLIAITVKTPLRKKH